MKLLNMADVKPSTYNPRSAVPERLDWVELSLRKLGFLLPIYATEAGEILSGHQRHYVAERMGWTYIPVVVVRDMELSERQAINIVFNRGTNDMGANATPEKMTTALLSRNVLALAEQLPDKQEDERYPCMRAESVPLQQVVDANAGRWVDYARNLARVLANKGIYMPVICRRDYTVVNGIGRVHFLAEKKAESVEVVFVSDAEAEFADAMLNLLSMDFDVHTRYADILRYNSFRRARGIRPDHLGLGMILPLGYTGTFEFDIHEETHRAAWLKFFGERVLDFGAGRLEDVGNLRHYGVQADAFEPYVLHAGSDEINPEGARALAREFLAQVARGGRWTTIFLQAVLNSVPFHNDRRCVLAIIQALCDPNTLFTTYTSSVLSSKIRQMETGEAMGQTANEAIQFLLNYEPNVTLGEFGSKPKMQKFFTDSEMLGLIGEFFRVVELSHPTTALVMANCRQPKAVRRKFLREALELEFNLPYPDGTRMGLVDEALAAFGKRLGTTL